MSQNERFTGQIAVHKTPSKLLEFIDSLNLASLTDYASIHAGATKPCENNGKRVYSTIRVVAQDYSRKGENSVRARANISPSEVYYLASAIKYGVPKYFKHESEKIFGQPNSQGFFAVAKLSITRFKTNEEDRSPQAWRVDIENGKGIKATDENGGTFCREDSYVCEKKVFLKLTDYEFFSLMIAVERFLTVWESTHGGKLLCEGREARDASWAAYHGTGGNRNDD